MSYKKSEHTDFHHGSKQCHFYKDGSINQDNRYNIKDFIFISI